MTVVLDSGSPLTGNAQYDFRIGTGVLEDAKGNAYPGTGTNNVDSNHQEYGFYTGAR